MQCGALWENFEKCYSVCTDLDTSGSFFQYSYLYTEMITICLFLVGVWGGGGIFHPSNTLDRTLLSVSYMLVFYFGGVFIEGNTAAERLKKRWTGYNWKTETAEES